MHPKARQPRGAPGWQRGWRWLWASPNTLIGLAFGLLLMPFGARLRIVDGVIEIAARPRPPRRRWPFAAITLGHVVLGTHAQELQRLRAHERVHVRQCERWGPLFLPAYALAGLWQWLRGRRAYRDHPFEVEARRLGGGCGRAFRQASPSSVFVRCRGGGWPAVRRRDGQASAECRV